MSCIDVTKLVVLSSVFVGKTCRIILRQMLKISITLAKTNTHLFYRVSCKTVKCVWVNAANSFFNIVFQFLHASWGIPINYFFGKFPYRKVWRSPTRDMFPVANIFCVRNFVTYQSAYCLILYAFLNASRTV